MKPPAVVLVAFATLVLGLAVGIQGGKNLDHAQVEAEQALEGIQTNTINRLNDQLTETAGSLRAEQALELHTAASLAEARAEISTANQNASNAAPVEATPVSGITFVNAGDDSSDQIQNFCRSSASPEGCAAFLQLLVGQLGQSQKPSDQLALKIIQGLLH